MIRFKDFLLEGAAMFAKMTRAEWEKPKAKTNDLRTDILKDAIANNNPIPDIDGKNIIVLNTKQNLKSIDNFTKSRDNVFFLDVKGGKTIQSNVIGKSPLFGGAGKGAGRNWGDRKWRSITMSIPCSITRRRDKTPILTLYPRAIKEICRQD